MTVPFPGIPSVPKTDQGLMAFLTKVKENVELLTQQVGGTRPILLPTFKAVAMPPNQPGLLAYASDGCKAGETQGSGTGTLMISSLTKWWPVFTETRFGIAFSCADISTKTPLATLARVSPGIPWTIPAMSPKARGHCAAPTANTDFPVLQNGAQVAVARWASGVSDVTVINTTPIVFKETDYVDLVMPSTLNGMSGPFSLTLMGIR